MSLPPALQARLAKRGLIGNNNKDKSEILKKRAVEEEVIAESYDEPNDLKKNQTSRFDDSFNAEKKSDKKFQHHPVMEKRRQRMLKIYPLPPNWIEVPDFNTNRYYYWNTLTDEVCWMSPSYPKAKKEIGKKIKQSEIVIKSPFIEAKKVDSNRKEDKKAERSRSTKKLQKDEIDPMDPAAYSDIPRGKWSDGLEK